MNFRNMKNFLIIALIGAAVYQTGVLWLDEYASHNFFYTIFQALKSGSGFPSENTAIISPKSIVVGYGNRRYSVFYPKQNQEAFLDKGYDLIEEVIENGVFIGLEEADWTEYIAAKTMILNYSFLVSASEYAKGFGVKTGSEIGKINAFDYVILAPEKSEADGATVYFIDSEKNEAYCYSLQQSKAGAALYSAIDQFAVTEEESISYISTVQSGFNLFKPSVFVPQWTGTAYYYKTLQKNNPFVINGELSETALQSGVEGFFNNFAARYGSQEADETILFSDETTVVKYYPQGTLEYYKYDQHERNSEQSLSTAYNACVNFMKKDATLNTEIYLSDVQMGSEGLVFYFDYCVNGFIIKIDQDMQEEAGITHAIEVVVKNNSVKRYKRYMYNYILGDVKDQKVTVDFSAAINDVFTSYENSDTISQVDDIRLGYLDNGKDTLLLHWLVRIGEEIFYCDAFK